MFDSRARGSFAVVATDDRLIHSTIILAKGPRPGTAEEIGHLSHITSNNQIFFWK